MLSQLVSKFYLIEYCPLYNIWKQILILFRLYKVNGVIDTISEIFSNKSKRSR